MNCGKGTVREAGEITSQQHARKRAQARKAVHDVAAHHGTEQHVNEGEKGGDFTCRFFPSSLSSPVRMSQFEDDANTKMRDNSEKKCASSLL